MKDSSDAINKDLARHCKLRGLRHDKRPAAVNCYMIGNKFGHIIGGNLMTYMFNNEQNDRCFPTIFKSRRSIEHWLRYNSDKVADIEKACYNLVKREYEEVL